MKKSSVTTGYLIGMIGSKRHVVFRRGHPIESQIGDHLTEGPDGVLERERGQTDRRLRLLIKDRHGTSKLGRLCLLERVEKVVVGGLGIAAQCRLVVEINRAVSEGRRGFLTAQRDRRNV